MESNQPTTTTKLEPEIGNRVRNSNRFITVIITVISNIIITQKKTSNSNSNKIFLKSTIITIALCIILFDL
jgi:hypothetical protein